MGSSIIFLDTTTTTEERAEIQSLLSLVTGILREVPGDPFFVLRGRLNLLRPEIAKEKEPVPWGKWRGTLLTFSMHSDGTLYVDRPVERYGIKHVCTIATYRIDRHARTSDRACKSAEHQKREDGEYPGGHELPEI